uniref:Enoyl reductase (ER) domain-containing protein n=1 Tax=Globisporangium ultimum (strain ATCC 200006 / CBS 805.95 / DAOM BR144) TaxID=431595 RepID=K3WWA1_GLOUD
MTSNSLVDIINCDLVTRSQLLILHKLTTKISYRSTAKAIPSYRSVQVHTLSTDFRAATKIIDVPELPTASAGHVVVKNHFVGINATDINITAGGYGSRVLPFLCGLEAAGIVTEVGPDVETFKVGDAVVYQKFGAFSEFTQVQASTVTKTPVLTPAVLPLTVCGVSASIALEQVGQMKKGGETVLVTAAAGGTGQFVVQLAKLAGNHVIGTCSSDEKVEYLKSLGCDRVINYTKEDVNTVLKAEYPKGVDLVFEAVGGDMFKAAVDNIAVHGRIIVFGYISNYHEADKQLLVSQVNPTLLMKSASVRGFLLHNHEPHIADHIARLLALIEKGKLTPGMDPTEYTGLEAIPKAIDRMYNKQNVGKLVVKLA